MAATKYIVTATAQHAESKPFSRKEYAVREAELRAEALRHVEAVTVVTTAGATVHTTQVVVPKAPAKGRQGARREALRPAAVNGWEVIYDKIKTHGAEVLRSTHGNDEGVQSAKRYAIYCVEHGHLHPLGRLIEERDARRNGGWCPACTGGTTGRGLTDEQVDLTINHVVDNIAAGFDEEELAAMRAINAAAFATGVWNPDAAAEVCTLDQLKTLEALGLLELAVNAADNVWAYLTDKGEQVMEAIPA